MHRVRRLHWLMLSLIVAAVLTSVAQLDARGSVTVDIGKYAALVDAGQAVEIEVEVSCTASYKPLEAFVYVVQDGYTSQFAGIPVRCTNHVQKYVVVVRAFPDSPFHAGEAYASAYLLVQSPTGATVSGGDAHPIEIR